VILTPDQRLRVFISSTLEELAEERAIRRLHLVPVRYESGARPHPPCSRYRAYLDQSQGFRGHLLAAVRLARAGHGDLGLEDDCPGSCGI
jgi:hypothetical protein